MSLHLRSALVFFIAPLSIAPSAASDVIAVPTSTSVQISVHEEPTFDWAGFYAGVYGTTQSGANAGMQYGGGIQAGVNAQIGFYLVGAEVAVQGLTGGNIGNTTYGQVLGRAGLVIADDVLVYAAGGYGIDLGPSDNGRALVGGGVELAVTDQLSIEAQYLHGFSLEGGEDKNQVTLGANFHF